MLRHSIESIIGRGAASPSISPPPVLSRMDLEPVEEVDREFIYFNLKIKMIKLGFAIWGWTYKRFECHRFKRQRFEPKRDK